MQALTVLLKKLLKTEESSSIEYPLNKLKAQPLGGAQNVIFCGEVCIALLYNIV